jgi:simple sugar transport system ATP-binding protein
MPAASLAPGPLLELRGIVKTFPGVRANDGIDLDVAAGEVHALLGENGAGKSTLMNIAYGLYQPDAGSITVRGRVVRIPDPRAAIDLGIGMVHQHFMLVPVLSVADNILLGREDRRGPFLDRAPAVARLRAVAGRYGLDLQPEALIRDLSVGEQQRVEITKALYRNAEILILDEPTAVLTPQETDGLFRMMRSLADEGKAIIFITHKLKEVLAVADRITVLRAGRVAGTTVPGQTTEAELASLMVGRQVLLRVKKGEAHPAAPVLSIRSLEVLNARRQLAVNQLALEVHSGEIFGLAGVDGNGQTELVEALMALRPIQRGRVMVGGRDVTRDRTRRILDTGVAHIPEDRHRHGLVLEYSVADNLILSTYGRPPFTRALQLQPAAIARNAREQMDRFDIRATGPDAPARVLSGGNQQKVVVARELSRQIRLLIADQPTRGLDVGSIEFIHRLLVERRDAGCAIFLVSAELDEILALADRIGVIYRGRLMAVLPAAQADRQRLGLLMAGSAA